MILKFPDLDTLRLALTTGAVPPAAGASAASAGFDDAGAVWVETAASLPRAAQNDLRRLGVQVARASGVELSTSVGCWAELLPLRPDPAPPEAGGQTPVLFELPSGEGLARLVTEILRLGNDRQGFRWLEDPAAKNGGGRALLRVVGPPYYSLLRALDRDGKGESPAAFVEQAPGVWVELGYTHPLAAQLKPPAGKILLLRPPRRWTVLDDAPFRDVYEVLEFPLPERPVRWQDRDLGARVRVAPSLKPGGPAEGAELWVLRDDPVEALNRFVQNADDVLLRRLAFAVGEKGGRQVIALRVRPSKLPPPVLVLKAEGYKPYLKLPNLFLPSGTRLHPPLRRDVVRKLLADDPAQVTWLAPGPGGTFTPEGLPEEAFRPLSEWVDYVLDHDREALDAWVQATRFDFEPFVCADDERAKPKRPPAEKPRTPKGPKGRPGDVAAPDVSAFEAADRSRKKTPVADDDDPLAGLVPTEPSIAQKQLKALEERFLAVESGLDAPGRQALWPELAALNAVVGSVDDSGVCWMNALWGAYGPAGAYAWHWFRTEATAVPARAEKGLPRGRVWTTGATTAAERSREVSGDDLDRLLTLDEPATADVRSLAAYLVWAAGRTPPPVALVERLAKAQRFLEAHEKFLPVRAAWLAWSHLTRLSGGDVLALARARDRLLERLFQNGLRPEQDLPGFLRFSGQPTSQRFRGLRQWLRQMNEKAAAWSRKAPANAGGPGAMEGFLDLIFAFGLARLGEADSARELLHRAHAALIPRDDGSRRIPGPDEHERREVQSFLYGVYEYRVKQSLEGKPHAGPLPSEHLEYLENMGKEQAGRMPRYGIDRLRQHSRILDPDTKIDPYRHWQSREGGLDRALVELADLIDRQEVADRVRKLLSELPRGAKGADARAKVLRAALEQAPRVGEAFAREVLEKAVPAYDELPEAPDPATLVERAKYLERGLFVAAHFDALDVVQQLVARFQRMLGAQRGAPAVQALDELAGPCLRGLRKLGMREEIDALLRKMADLILEGRDLKAVDVQADPTWPAALRSLLHVAGGWYYFGRDRQAEPVLAAARSLLLKGELPTREKTQLACAYAASAGQAPVEAAQARLEELFAKMEPVSDTFTTGKYYSLSQLDVAEAVVLAVVSDDFTLGTQARRWLDDDEFLVRRRIHHDLRAAMG
jgi:hypothetical protein